MDKSRRRGTTAGKEGGGNGKRILETLFRFVVLKPIGDRGDTFVETAQRRRGAA